MNGTRIARTAALTAALGLGAALTLAALLPTTSHDGLRDRPTTALTAGRSMALTTATTADAGTPRTTPPPTLPQAEPTSGRPAPASTVEHS